MIVGGSRFYGKRNVVKAWSYCENCQQYVKSTSYSGQIWQHLYFIPLIPSGQRLRVIQECKRCSHGLHLAEQDIPRILNHLRQSTEDALMALISGEATFDHQGTIASSVSCLVDAAETLLCLEAEDHLRLVLAALQEKQLTHAYHLVNGKALELQGKLDEATHAYAQAASLASQDPFTLSVLGQNHLKRKNYQAARELYEHLLALVDQQLPVLLVLLTVYESLQDHARLSETYERCFEFVPELSNDKKVFKAYTKACKKSGRQPLEKQ